MGGRDIGEVREVANPSAIVQCPKKQPKLPMLSDSYGLVRICTTRTSRIVPTYGSKSGKGFGRTATLQQRHKRWMRNIFLFKWQLQSAPFRPVAQCDYYVITLRRIIR